MISMPSTMANMQLHKSNKTSLTIVKSTDDGVGRMLIEIIRKGWEASKQVSKVTKVQLLMLLMIPIQSRIDAEVYANNLM